jgi:hypothetical protein
MELWSVFLPAYIPDHIRDWLLEREPVSEIAAIVKSLSSIQLSDQWKEHVLTAVTGFWWRYIGKTCEESVRSVTDKILPLSASDPNIRQNRANFRALLDQPFGRTAEESCTRFSDFLKFYLRFGSAESDGIDEGLRGVLPEYVPLFDDQVSDDAIDPSFFQGFHPELDKRQALRELEANRSSFCWVIIQGMSFPNQFVIWKIETVTRAWQEVPVSYFAKIPDHESRFSVDLHDGARLANNWKEVLALADLNPLQGLSVETMTCDPEFWPDVFDLEQSPHWLHRP